jgi:hypothetical protein
MGNHSPNPNSSAAKSRWGKEAIAPIQAETDEQAALIGRTIHDLPAVIPQRAKDVAQLTAIRCYQRKKLPEVMAALDRLRTQPKEEWDKPYMVADADVFDWRKAPVRRYTSFEDFYRRELEPVLGEWAKLKHNWSDFVAGKISGKQLDKRILGNAKGGQPGNQNAKKLDDQGAQPGNQNASQGKNESDNVRIVSLGEEGGNSAAYIRARLKRDGKTELLGKVERGEISAHKAAKEAGYRKQAVCHLPTVPGFLKAAQAHLSPEQRLELKEAL